VGRKRNPVMSAVGYSAIKHVMNEGWDTITSIMKAMYSLEEFTSQKSLTVIPLMCPAWQEVTSWAVKLQLEEAEQWHHCASGLRTRGAITPFLVTCLRCGAYFRGKLSYLAPLGSENISAPYFKQCFFQGGYYPPPPQTESNTSLPVPRQK